MEMKMTEKSFEILMQKMGEYDSSNDAKMVLNSIVASLTQLLVKGEDIMLEEFGTFRVTANDVAMRGPTVVPGYPAYPREKFYSNRYKTKIVKIKFDKVLKQKINDL